MFEPHSEQRELAARDQQQGDEDDRRRRDVVAHDPQHGLGDAEGEAGGRHHEAGEVEEDHGWKSRITYFSRSRHRKPLKSSHEMRGTTLRIFRPERSPTP
jgi:hypothetical protein